jgi:hypothetical protein
MDGPINRDAFETYVEQVLGRNSASAASSSCMISQAIRVPGSVNSSKQQALDCSISRPAGLTSIQSKMPSRSSRLCCAKQQSELLKVCGHPSAKSLLLLSQPSAKTSSPLQDMMQTERIPPSLSCFLVQFAGPTPEIQINQPE